MTTALWRGLPKEPIFIGSIRPTQRGVKWWFIPAFWIKPTTGDSAIYVVEFDGVLYLEDGHTRLARAKLLRRRQIQARVLRLRA